MDLPANIGEVRLAVLIDADNVSSTNIQPMMEEIARYGNPTIKRIYGDWTRPNLGSWKTLLLDYAISPVQQFAYTSGKNATDSAMIIDAMDILFEGRVDGYCLVSSDSDFTRLAMRLREAGKLVIGIGEQKTPNAFISACDRFIFQEVIRGQKKAKATHEPDPAADKKKASPDKSRTKTKAVEPESPAIRKIDDDLISLISSSIEDVQDDNGWAFLAEVGNLMMKKQPSFDARNYGFSRLTPLIQSIGTYEVDVRDSGGSGQSKHIYVRIREEKKNGEDKKNVKAKNVREF
ncbi:MAG TPA: NYN domain-containing protein [Clostridiaceae bacterium]|nr:NYN domain-containing protein [Clostridiaceae bacterium]